MIEFEGRESEESNNHVAPPDGAESATRDARSSDAPNNAEADQAVDETEGLEARKLVEGDIVRLKEFWDRQQSFMDRIDAIYQIQGQSEARQGDTLDAMTTLGIDLERAKDMVALGVIPDAWSHAYQVITSREVTSINNGDLAELHEALSNLNIWIAAKQERSELFVAAQERGEDFFTALQLII